MKYYSEVGEKAGELDCYVYLGIAYYELCDYTKAIIYHKKALKIAKKRDKKIKSDCYANLGNAYSNLGDYTKDIKYQEKALEIKKEIRDKVGESSCYISLGNTYSNLGDYTKAINYQEKALNIAKEIGDVYGTVYATAQLSLGIIYNEQKPEMAYNNFKRSIDLTELIGGKIIEEVHRMGFYASHASRGDAYQFMIPVCLRLDKDREAFEYAERSKSKVFRYLLAASNLRPTIPKITSELKPLLGDEEKCLMMLRQIQRSMTKTVGISGASAVSPDNDEVETLDYILSELNKIYDKIEPIDPEYVSLRRGRPLSLDKIQNILLRKGNNNATILIEYFITKHKTFIFVISPQEFHIKIVEFSEEKLSHYIATYWKEVFDYRNFGYNGSTWLELSSYLIEPISEYLTKAELIYFVPYGLLHYIPIHALELDGDPLIKNHAIAYSPSASVLQFFKNKGSGFLKTCASFGIVFKEESKEVAKLFETTPYLDATKKKVIQNISKDILHFSCHGYFNTADPLSSGIALQDGILTAREIFNLKLNSELVTLSACQTGLNEAKPGDELIGLTRSLIYAGAASVIVSLWSVYDPSTRELMVEFYRQLKSGKDKATALQQAQIKVMSKEEYSHPYYWAPFILIGY